MIQLRKIREDKGIKQKELAARCSVRAATICNLEKGRIRNPRIETLRQIADVLGVSEPLSLLDEVA